MAKPTDKLHAPGNCTMNYRGRTRISELLVRCCHGTATLDEKAELDRLLHGDPEAMHFCVESLMNLSCLHATSSATSSRLAVTMGRLRGEATPHGDENGADAGDDHSRRIIPLPPESSGKRSGYRKHSQKGNPSEAEE